MNITVNVDSIDLGEYIDSHYDSDGDRVPAGTLGDAVVRQLVEKFSRSDVYKGLAERVRTLRDEEIRTQLAPVITEALASPIKRTNSYGEKTGEDTTLREVIVAEARTWLNSKKDDNYGRSTNGTHLQVMIRKAVEDAFQAEIADVVKKIRDDIANQQLEAKVGLPTGRWTAVDLAQLTVIFGSLQRGEVRSEDEFPPRRVTAEEITASVPKAKAPQHTDHDPGALDSECPGCRAESAAADQKAAEQ